MPIPDHIDVYLLDKEIAGTDMTALEVHPGEEGRGVCGAERGALACRAPRPTPPHLACAPPRAACGPPATAPLMADGPAFCACPLPPSLRQAVKSVDVERQRLEAEAEALADQQGDQVEARLEDIYER